MTTKEILQKYIKYYEDRNHKLIPNVSLVPEGDSTLLFVNSGMFPLVPYLSGEQHPLGKRLVDVQRCLRFEDIDDVGDARHTIAFHMIGNWSLGDYFKKEQLPWVYGFFIEELGIDPKRLYGTVFAGDEFAPKDTDSIEIIKQVFAKYGIDAKEGERIFACGRKSNWWQRGDAVGELGGPDSEVYYYLGEGSPEGKSPDKFEDEFLEIGNSVFMQYKKSETGWEPLSQKNVDFGGGLERTALVVQSKKDIFETDNFWPIIEEIQKTSGKNYYESEEVKRSMRILADHMRASVFLAMDGVVPSNKDQGYILRRILRRIVREGRALGLSHDISVSLVPVVCNMFSWIYSQLNEKKMEISGIFAGEEEKFRRTLEAGDRQVERDIPKVDVSNIDELAKMAFKSYESLGYPLEMFLAKLVALNVNISDPEKFKAAYYSNFNEHKEESRKGAEQKFKGGLADQSENTIKYHTVTHLLQRGLKNVLGDHVRQLGSNITNERLRFDFPNPKKLAEEELKQVQDFVNQKVSESIPVQFVMLPIEEAKKTGALYLKNETYPSEVKVYYIGSSIENAVSKEFCGGPHVNNTSELKPILIYKQESIGEGKMRIYAKFS